MAAFPPLLWLGDIPLCAYAVALGCLPRGPRSSGCAAHDREDERAGLLRVFFAQLDCLLLWSRVSPFYISDHWPLGEYFLRRGRFPLHAVGSLCCAELFPLLSSRSFRFAFSASAFGVQFSKFSQTLMSRGVLPLVRSGRRSMASAPTFKSFIGFELVFVYSAGLWFGFILLHVSVQLPNTIYWRCDPFSTVYSWPLCHKLIDHTHPGLFLGARVCYIALWDFLSARAKLFRLLKLCI